MKNRIAKYDKIESVGTFDLKTGSIMKKKIIITAIIIITFVLLFPMKSQLKDGGTVEYRALLYKISKVHRLVLREDMEKKKQYDDGMIIEILGVEVFNNVP